MRFELTNYRTVLLIPLVLLAAACGASNDPSQGKPPDGEKTTLTAQDRSIAELAKGVLAEELDVPPETISTDAVRAVDWPDSSIGCPQPDHSYAQVITPGHEITLRVDKQVYVIHETNGKAFLCK